MSTIRRDFRSFRFSPIVRDELARKLGRDTRDITSRRCDELITTIEGVVRRCAGAPEPADLARRRETELQVLVTALRRAQQAIESASTDTLTCLAFPTGREALEGRRGSRFLAISAAHAAIRKALSELTSSIFNNASAVPSSTTQDRPRARAGSPKSIRWGRGVYDWGLLLNPRKGAPVNTVRLALATRVAAVLKAADVPLKVSRRGRFAEVLKIIIRETEGRDPIDVFQTVKRVVDVLGDLPVSYIEDFVGGVGRAGTPEFWDIATRSGPPRTDHRRARPRKV